jgi:hypothetical protein
MASFYETPGGIQVTGTPSTGDVIEWDGTQYVPGTPSSGSPRLLPLRDPAAIVTSSTSGHIEQHPLNSAILRAKPRDFGTIANVISSGIDSWTAADTSKLTSGVASGDTVTLVHNGSTTGSVYNATLTAPRWTRAILKCAGRLIVVFHVAASEISGQFVGIGGGIMSSTGRWMVRGDIFNNGGTIEVRYIVNDTSFGANTNINAGQAATGVWFQLELDMTNLTVTLRYSLASYASGIPTYWTPGAGGAIGASLTAGTFSGLSYVECFNIERTAANTAPQGTISGWRNAFVPHGVLPASFPQVYGSKGFAATSDIVPIFEPPVLATASRPNLTRIKERWAAAAAKLAGYPMGADSGAVTFAIVGSNSSLASFDPSAGGGTPITFAAAGSLALRSTADAALTDDATANFTYWKAWMVFTSTGSIQPVSFDTAAAGQVEMAA